MPELSDADMAQIAVVVAKVAGYFGESGLIAEREELYCAGKSAGIALGLETAAKACEGEFVNEADLIPITAAHNSGYNEACHDCAAAIRARLAAL